MHDRKCESGGRFVYHEPRLPAIRNKIRPGVCQFSIEYILATAWSAVQSDRPSGLANAVLVTSPGGEIDNEEAYWDFGDLAAGLWGAGKLH